MKEKELQLIEKLAIAVGDTGPQIVEKYSEWYFMSGLVWAFIGLAIMVMAFKFKEPEKSELSWPLIRIVIFIIGALFVGCNLPDLLAPEGISIHRLILDIRG